ncbi:MAG: hypothetical protein MUE34_15325 [Acidimicrobiales bacterium]|nr:hypothetical protein [Acidimicrobiales bacterium]
MPGAERLEPGPSRQPLLAGERVPPRSDVGLAQKAAGHRRFVRSAELCPTGHGMGGVLHGPIRIA